MTDDDLERALSWPRRLGRGLEQRELFERRAVAEIVAEHDGCVDYLIAVLELAERFDLSNGAALAAARRATVARHVAIDDDGNLVLGDGRPG